MRLFHQLVVSTLVLGLCVSTAEAQFGGTINIGGKKLGLSSGDAKKKLRALDSRLEPAFRIANQKYGRNAAQELTKLQEAEAIVAGVEKDMSGTLKLAGSEYSRVENRIKDVKSKIAIGYLNQKCSAARAAINETNRTGKIASEEQLKALDDAVAHRKAAPNGAEQSSEQKPACAPINPRSLKKPLQTHKTAGEAATSID